LDDDKLAAERKHLLTVEALSIIEYIRTSVEILLNLKMEEDSQGGGRSDVESILTHSKKGSTSFLHRLCKAYPH
jgi:hypothetical protein